MRKPRETSLKTLKSALELREDDVFENLKPDLDHLADLPVHWHSTCYETYTSSHNLKFVQRRKSASSTVPSEASDVSDSAKQPEAETTRVSRSQTSPTDWSKCIFCKNRTHKKVKVMVNARTFEAGTTIENAAKDQGDEEMLRLLRGVKDLVAAEAKYHKACYSSYVSKSNLKFTEGKKEDSFASAFAELAEQITTDLMTGKAFDMAVLLKKYHDLLKTKGVKETTYTAQRLKNRMIHHFGEAIVFHQQYRRNKSELVYSSSISLQDIINAAYQKAASATTDETIHPPEAPAEENEKIRLLYRTAALIKAEIKECQGIPVRPPDINDLTLASSKARIPESLYWMLRWIIETPQKEGEEEFRSPECSNLADERRVVMIAQDVVHCTSHGLIKMPKHVSLAMAVRHLTGSKQLVTMLNRMGHCSSYDDVEAIDTSLAKEVLAQSDLSGIVVPSNIVPGGFVQAAADNNDLNEETLDGKTTTHATTLVLYQKGQFGSAPRRRIYADHSKRERSLKSTGRCQTILELSTYGKRPINRSHEGKINKEWFTFTDPNLHSSQMDLAWALVRLCPTKMFEVGITPVPTDQQIIPGWSGFNAMVQPAIPSITNIGYCPMIDGSPTESSTVYTVMKNVQAMMTSLRQGESVITFDLAIYVKAKEIQWRRPEEFSNMVIRLGGFHVATNYLSLLGKKYDGSGIEDLLIESGVYGSGTVSHLLTGKSYNRGMRGHKLLMEAMFRLEWQAFVTWLPSHGGINEAAVVQAVTACRQAVQDDENIEEALQQLKQHLRTVDEQFTMFKNEARSKSDLFAFWDDYVTMVQLLLQFIRAERSGDWSLHLSAAAGMTPHFFAMDRQNYSRWLPVYLADMNRLLETHPTVHQELVTGNHAVSRSNQPFAQVWTDMALEQSINLDSKTKGGIVGITQKPGALERWFLTSHERALITTSMKEMCGLQDSDRVGTHKEAGTNRRKRDEGDVMKILSTVTSGLMTNPFCLDDEDDGDSRIPLTNIATGVVMPKDGEQHLLQSYELGKTQMNTFVEQRLNTSEVPFWNPIPKLGIKTFSTLAKKKAVKTTDDKMITVSADRELFGRLVISAKTRQIDLKEVLTYELSTVPCSLAHNDGSLRKTTKSVLLSELEKVADVQGKLPTPTPEMATAYLFDVMASVQMVKDGGASTFGELASKHYNLITSPLGQNGCTRVDAVIDQYRTKSIKAGERTKRGASTALEIKIHGPSTPLPKQWTKYITNQRNKTNLTQFLAESWCSVAKENLQPGQQLVIAGGFKEGERAVMVRTGHCEDVAALRSDHEEADTRLLLHAEHASHSHTRIVIQSPDTDVAVLCATHFTSLNCDQLWFRTGVKDKLRHIPMHTVAAELGPEVCDALLGLHAVTGCDSNSSLCGIGKKKAFNMLSGSEVHQHGVAQLGTNVTVSEDTLSGIEAFLCNLYTKDKKAGRKANDVRYWLFCQRGQRNEALPPTSDSLLHHIKRANYQALVWRRALIPVQDLPPPEDHGWMCTDDSLTPVLMTKDPAPSGLVEITSCRCRKSLCSRRDCACKKNELPCTEACACMAGEDCQNPKTLVQLVEDDDDEDDD